MIDLNLKLDQDRRDDSARYYVPAHPSNGADRLHISERSYRLDYVAVPRDGSEPLVALERQTRSGRDYLSPRGRRVLPLSGLRSLVDPNDTVDRITADAYVQQVRDALIRAYLDEARSVSATEIASDAVDYAAGDRTLFPADPSTERMLPDLADDDMSRVVVRIGSVALTGEWQRVLDQRSGLWVEVRRAYCGAECQCAGEVRLIEQPEDAPALSWGGPAATISVDENVPLLDDEPDEEAQLDATMREQMATWPDDTLALLTVGELRDVLRKAHDHGADDEEEPCAEFLDRLVRELPDDTWPPTKERAAHGLPDVGRPASFERPGSAYEGVHGYDPHTHEAIIDPRIVAIIEQLRGAVENGYGLSLDDDHAAALLRYLGWQSAGHVVPEVE